MEEQKERDRIRDIILSVELRHKNDRRISEQNIIVRQTVCEILSGIYGRKIEVPEWALLK